MSSTKYNKFLNLFLKNVWAMSLLFGAHSLADPPRRIEAFTADKAEVMKVYLKENLSSVFKFPCEIGEISPVNPNDYAVDFSPSNKDIIFLRLKRYSPSPSNLIARCEGRQNFIVIDLVPSKSRHQDVVFIKYLRGSIPSKDDAAFAKKPLRIIEVSPPVLVDSSDGSHLKGKAKEEFLAAQKAASSVEVTK